MQDELASLKTENLTDKVMEPIEKRINETLTKHSKYNQKEWNKILDLIEQTSEDRMVGTEHFSPIFYI